jgi:hypothetical protein
MNKKETYQVMDEFGLLYQELAEKDAEIKRLKELLANREKDIGDAWDAGADAQFHRMSHTVDFGYMGKRKASYIEQVKNKL